MRAGSVVSACGIFGRRTAYRGVRLGVAAASAIDDSKQIEEFAREGLRYEPSSVHLINSLAFSLALQGHHNDALGALREIRPESADRSNFLVSEANRGLIALRQGDLTRATSCIAKPYSAFVSCKSFD